MGALRIGGAAVNQTPLDWEGNFQNLKKAIEKAKAQEVYLLCFPELSITGYGSEDLTPWEPGKISAMDFFGAATPIGDIVFEKKGVKYGFEICEDAWRGDLRRSRNQWKRERIAPSFHLDEFNIDPKTWYRFPILSGAYREELMELETMEEE